MYNYSTNQSDTKLDSYVEFSSAKYVSKPKEQLCTDIFDYQPTPNYNWLDDYGWL